LEEDNSIKKCQVYAVPENLVHAGKDNVITIRVFNIQHRGGIVEGPVGFVKRSNLTKNYRDLSVPEN